MNQCHECGNQLTEVDTFCPFCGIALEPSSIEEVELTSGELTEDSSAPDEVSGSENEFTDMESVFDNHKPVDENKTQNESDGQDEADGFIDSSILTHDSVAAEDAVPLSDDLVSMEGVDPEAASADEIPVEADSIDETTVEDTADDTMAETSAEPVLPGVIDESNVDETVDDTAVETAVEPVLDDSENLSQPENSFPQIEETPKDLVRDEGFLEDSTVIMSSFPVIESGDKIEEAPEDTSIERESVESGDTDAVSDKLDLEGETIVVKSGSLDLPPEAPKEDNEAGVDTPDDDVLSKTIGYIPSDLEELKHIDESDLELIPKETDVINEENISETRDGSVAIGEDVLEPVSELGEVDNVDDLIPALDGIDESAQGNVLAIGSNDSKADQDLAEPDLSMDEQVAHSETTPNFGVEDTDGSNKKKLKPLDEGTVLNNRYEIVRKIGGGGMGAVYLANDKNLGGVLRAVKEMVQSYIEEEQQEKAINDFKRESMLLTSLEHSAIPTIYDYFFDDKEARFYLVMKYISGGDLSGKIRSAPEGRLDEKSVVEWGSQIADVLDYLHNRQPPIVYRDLKPANVMVDGNSGRVMLIDFGIARWVNKEEKGVTAVGTMGYAPPELFSGNVEPRSDIYSLGSTMFHLMTGADPQSNPLLIFDFQKHPRPRQINPALSDQIEQILMRAVEYSADKRFTSAGEMRDALVAHLDRLNSGTASYGIDESPKAVGLADQPVFCGFCGQKIVATDMFCAFCGAKQPLAQPGVHAEEYAPVGVTVKLLVEGTSDLDAPAFSLVKDDNLLGRRDPISDIFPEVDLSKFDPQTKISRKHARIWRDGDKFMLEDLNSSNGTLLKSPRNDSIRLAPHQSHVLTNGDKIQMGDTILHFLVG